MNARRLTQRNSGAFPDPRTLAQAFPSARTLYVPHTRARRVAAWLKSRPDFPVKVGFAFAVTVLVVLWATGASAVPA